VHARSIVHTAGRSEDGGWRSEPSTVERERERKREKRKREREGEEERENTLREK